MFDHIRPGSIVVTDSGDRILHAPNLVDFH